MSGVTMGRGPCAYKATDVTRAVKAVIAAGQPVACVRVAADFSLRAHPRKSPQRELVVAFKIRLNFLR